MPTRNPSSSISASSLNDWVASRTADTTVFTDGPDRRDDFPKNVGLETENPYKTLRSDLSPARGRVGSGVAGAGTMTEKGLVIDKADLKVMFPSRKALMDMIAKGDTTQMPYTTYIKVPIGNDFLNIALNSVTDDKGKTVYQANGQWVNDAFSREGRTRFGFGKDLDSSLYDVSYKIADEINRLLGPKLRKD
jgi:hypothetical protein